MIFQEPTASFRGSSFPTGVIIYIYDTNPSTKKQELEFTKMGNLMIPVQTPFLGVLSALGGGRGKMQNSADFHPIKRVFCSDPFRLRKRNQSELPVELTIIVYGLLYLHLQLSVCHASKIQTLQFSALQHHLNLDDSSFTNLQILDISEMILKIFSGSWNMTPT